MRLLVFSDIHGNSYAMESFLHILPGIKYDKIVFLGDIFGYYYDQEKCIRLLKSVKDLVWLKGNHDEYALEAYDDSTRAEALIRSYGHSYDGLAGRIEKSDMEMISSLSPFCEIVSEGRKIGCFHGRPSDHLEGRIYNDTELTKDEFEAYDIVLAGHTHCKIDRVIGKTHIISPGSLGQPRDGKGYGFAVVDTEEDHCEFVNIKVDNAILKRHIDRFDPYLDKLYDVLNREITRIEEE